MICFFSSGDSIEVSPVEPMISTAEVPLSSWNLSRVRKAAKSTEPSLLNGVISATNEPVKSFCDILCSNCEFAQMISRRALIQQAGQLPRFVAAEAGIQAFSRSELGPRLRGDERRREFSWRAPAPAA